MLIIYINSPQIMFANGLLHIGGYLQHCMLEVTRDAVLPTSIEMARGLKVENQPITSDARPDALLETLVKER